MDEQIRFPCPRCGKRLKAPFASAGKRARCSCGQGVVVPDSDPLPDDDELPLPPDPSGRRVWFRLAGGAAALSALAVLTVFLTRPGRVQTPDKDAVAAATPPEPKREPKAEPKPKNGPTTEPKTDPQKSPAPEPPRVSDPRQFHGRWVGNDLALTIQPDGKGRAEVATFSQGQGFFRLTRDEQPVVLTADFAVEVRGGAPRLSFTIGIGQRPGEAIHSVATPEHPRPSISYRQSKAESTYQFTILPGSGADEMRVREADGKIRPNPMVLKRRAVGDEPKRPAGEPKPEPKSEPGPVALDVNKLFPLKAGMKYTYRLSIPADTQVHYDPFFVNAPGLLSSNRTHGSAAVKAADKTFSIHVAELVSESEKVTEAKVRIDDSGRDMFLPPLRYTEVRLSRFLGEESAGLGIHGLLDGKADGLRVGTLLARLPVGKRPDHDEVKVPAGAFQAVRSRVTHSPNNNNPEFTQESWVAEGVGVVKYRLLDAGARPLFAIELMSK